MGRQGASAPALLDCMRPSCDHFEPARKSMRFVEDWKRTVGGGGRVTMNVAVVRQAGGSRLVAEGQESSESRSRNRRGKRKEEDGQPGERRHIPEQAMAAPPMSQPQRLTPNDHHHHHHHHHQYCDDDQRHRHPAHTRDMTTTTHRAHNYDRRYGSWPCDLVTPSRNAMPLLAVVVVVVYLLVGFAPIATEAVDCFKCSSRNGSNPACEDPFHNLNTTRVNSPILPDPQPSVIYHTPCYAGKKGRDGLFPASACIKLTGVFDTTGETLVVRHCALDSGTLTQDTELARMSHCGKFQFEGDLLRGCVLACPEDACNSAQASRLLGPIGSQRWLNTWGLVWFATVILVTNQRR